MNVRESVTIRSPSGKDEACIKFIIDIPGTPFVLHEIAQIGQEYTLSFYAKSETPGGITAGGISTDTSSEWQRYVITFSAESDDVPLYFNATGTYYIHKIQLEEGNKDTTWALAPDDEEERLTDAIARITANESSIELMVSTQESFAGRLTTTESQVSVLQENIDLRVKYTDLDAYSTTAQMEAAINVSANSITQTVSEVYTTKKEFNDLEVGGRNLLLNTNGSATCWGFSRKSGTYSIANKEMMGVTGIEVTIDEVSTGYSTLFFRSNNILLDALKPNSYYTISFDILSTFDIGDNGETILLTKTNRKNSLTNEVEIGHVPAGVRTKVQVTLKTVSEFPEIAGQTVYIGNINKIGTIEICNLKMEYGNKATDWTPAPEDTEEEITSAKTIATQTADKFEWLVASGDSATTFTLTDRMATLIADTISFNGDVKVTGDMLVDGTVTAAKINVGDLFAQDITATGSITGVTLNGVSINANTITAKDGYSIYVEGFDAKQFISASSWVDTTHYGVNFGIPDVTGNVYVGVENADKTIVLSADNISVYGGLDIWTGGALIREGDVEIWHDLTVGEHIISALETGSYLNGNKGNAIIRSDAAAGKSVMLAKMNATDGVFTMGCGGNAFRLNYTDNETISSNTNELTHYVHLLNSEGNMILVHSGSTNASIELRNDDRRIMTRISSDGRAGLYSSDLSDWIIFSDTDYATTHVVGAEYVLIRASEFGLRVGTGFTSGNDVVCPVTSSNTAKDGTVYLGASSSRWVSVHAKNGSIQTSDERDKNILGNIDQRYLDLFMDLKPILYQWKDGNDTKTHMGFGAQSTEAAAIKCGITSEELAAVSHDRWTEPGEDGRTDRYGLNYAEITALTVPIVQGNKKSIQALESQIETLNYRLDQAYDEIEKLKKAI